MHHTVRLRWSMAVAAVTALLLAIAVLPSAAPAAADDPLEITFLHDTHFHGNFADEFSDIARYFALVEQRKAAHEHALFLANGDDIAPSLLSGVFRGDHMIEALNAAPVDYNTYGNHEFDYGPEKLRELVEATETFTWVSANVRDTADTSRVFAEDLGAELFVIEEVGGVNVGITGLAPRGMASITSMGDAAIEIPYLEAMDEVVPLMYDAGADIIVVSSHLCTGDSVRLAEERSDIHLVVGDHCSRVWDEPRVINGTIVNVIGDEFEHLGELTLQVSGGEVTGFDYTRHDLAALDIEPHPEIQAIVDRYNAQLDDELDVVIGERTVEWDARREIVRTRESAIGNWLTDSYADGLGADIGLQNGGGIRGDRVYPPGEITRREIVENLPFDNTMVVKEIPGDRVLALVDEIVTADGVRMQLSGLEVVYDSSLPADDRVQRVTMGCEPVDPDATYTIATIDFLAEGASGMEGILDDLPYLRDPNEGQLNSTYVITYLEERQDGPVTTDVDGRLHRLDADYAQPDPLCGPLGEEPTAPVELTVDFDDIPGRVNAGRTVPIRFTVFDPDGSAIRPTDLTGWVTHHHSHGEAQQADLRPHGGDGFMALVRTHRGHAGAHRLDVVDADGRVLGSTTFDAR